MTDPVFSIIVVSYGTREMTLECLRTVRDQTETPYELIVIDNASPDGSAEAIAAEFPDAIVMAETENHGFARANNIAAKRARGEFILLLNPDTLVLDHALDRLLAFARKTPAARIWGGRTLFADRSLNPTSCWRRMTLWNLFCRASGLATFFPKSALFHSEAYGGWDRSAEREVDIVTGCMLLISRADWAALDGFDRVFFMYGEEADLCLRAARDLGARPRFTPTAEIVHYGGGATTARTEKYVRIMKARVELARRHFSPWARPVALALINIWPWWRAFAAGLARRENIWREVWRQRADWRKGFE